jgi:hypothetical protein
VAFVQVPAADVGESLGELADGVSVLPQLVRRGDRAEITQQPGGQLLQQRADLPLAAQLLAAGQCGIVDEDRRPSMSTRSRAVK